MHPLPEDEVNLLLLVAKELQKDPQLPSLHHGKLLDLLLQDLLLVLVPLNLTQLIVIALNLLPEDHPR
jgi:hypothetical protein